MTFRNWLERRTFTEVIVLFAMLTFLAGLITGFVYGQYRGQAMVADVIEKKATTENPLERPFSVDGKYVYYVQKTNMTIEQYKEDMKDYKELFREGYGANKTRNDENREINNLKELFYNESNH